MNPAADIFLEKFSFLRMWKYGVFSMILWLIFSVHYSLVGSWNTQDTLQQYLESYVGEVYVLELL